MAASVETPMRTPVPVSCYIRTLNEERMIERVVRAAFLVADEVVIVDSGSTDRTKELAEAAGAAGFNQPWLGHGAQKRAAEDRCRNNWLLDLDADEIVTEELAASIRGLFADGEPDSPVYELELVTVPPYGERWSDFSLAYRRKLYDRRVIRMPDHKAWDQMDVPSDLKVGRLTGALDHYSFAGIEHVVAKLNRVSGVRARESRLKSHFSVSMRVLFALPVYFLRHYFLRGLWRAGLYGYAISVSAAIGRWLRDVKMLEIHMKAEGKACPESAHRIRPPGGVKECRGHFSGRSDPKTGHTALG